MGRYPLEPLAQVRAAEVDDAARALADAIAAREAAETRVEATKREEIRFLDEASRIEDREAIALASGVLRANDLARRDAFLIGASIEAEKRAAAVRSAEQSLSQALAAEESARAELAARKAQADAVERDRARFVANEKRIADVKEEENAEDAIRGVRRA